MTFLNNLDEMSEREREIAIYWRDKGLKHADPSPSTQIFMDKTNTNLAVISEKIENMFSVLRHNHAENKEDHQGIMSRQDHTNGDVNTLKIDVGKLQNWKSYLLGAWVVITFVSTILVPAMFYLYIQNLKYEINEQNVELTKTEINKYINIK